MLRGYWNKYDDIIGHLDLGPILNDKKQEKLGSLDKRKTTFQNFKGIYNSFIYFHIKAYWFKKQPLSLFFFALTSSYNECGVRPQQSAVALLSCQPSDLL